jgi:mannose-6-phosphate isomerase-like protein (cupin superfamily)
MSIFWFNAARPPKWDFGPGKERDRVELVRIAAASAYEAPRHHGMTMLRLQGGEASSAHAFTVGLSRAMPGGGAERSSSVLERVYLVLEGELFVSSGETEAALGPMDSCWIPAGEEREIANRTDRPVVFVVVMPTKEEEI